MKFKVGDLVQVAIDIPDGVLEAPLDKDDYAWWDCLAAFCVVKEVHMQYGKLAFYTIFSPNILPMRVYPHEIRKP